VRVLVVEDDPPFASLLRRALSSEGYGVDVASDGGEALELARVARYDLLLLDVMLPRLSGLEVCRRLREAQNDVPILILTARDAVEDRVQGLDLGADDYLVKPVALPELFARVRALLRRREGRRNPVLRVGSLTLEPARRVLLVAGTAVDLTGKEFAILELFMRHPERVFTREEIGERVWDFAYEGGSNLIDVYVGRLRRKLGPASSYLVTRRGHGYSLRS
jgi:two-component system OmpR family response regulator